MKFDLTRLKSGLETYILVDFTYHFSKEELKGTDLLSIDDFKVVGEITKNALDEIEISVNLQGKMILPCAITLKPVEVPLDAEIEENITNFMKDNQENSIICENTLDIFPIIWENILMEIPMKVVSDDISDRTLSGNGWKVISEMPKEEATNPELEKLKDLL